MLAPRFTLRTGLIGLTAGSVVAIVLRDAVNGEPWAIGAAVGLGSLLLSLLLQAVAFGLSLAVSRKDPKEGDS